MNAKPILIEKMEKLNKNQLIWTSIVIEIVFLFIFRFVVLMDMSADTVGLIPLTTAQILTWLGFSLWFILLCKKQFKNIRILMAQIIVGVMGANMVLVGLFSLFHKITHNIPKVFVIAHGVNSIFLTISFILLGSVLLIFGSFLKSNSKKTIITLWIIVSLSILVRCIAGMHIFPGSELLIWSVVPMLIVCFFLATFLTASKVN